MIRIPPVIHPISCCYDAEEQAWLWTWGLTENGHTEIIGPDPIEGWVNELPAQIAARADAAARGVLYVPRDACLLCRVTVPGAEYLMVTDDVWQLTGADLGFLDLSCIEKLIGRSLVYEDFPDLPINEKFRLGWRCATRGVP